MRARGLGQAQRPEVLAVGIDEQDGPADRVFDEQSIGDKTLCPDDWIIVEMIERFGPLPQIDMADEREMVEPSSRSASARSNLSAAASASARESPINSCAVASAVT